MRRESRRVRGTFRPRRSVKRDMKAKRRIRGLTTGRTMAAAGLLTLALALAGCGTPDGGPVGSGDSGAGSDNSVSDTPQPGPNKGGGGEVVTPRPGMAGVHPVEWDIVRLADDGDSLWVRWWSGVEPCHVLDRVDVQAGRRVIMVSLFEGHVPGRQDVACPEMALLKEVEVAFTQPLDGRKIIDGAKLAELRDSTRCGPGRTAVKKCRLLFDSSAGVERPH